KHAAGVFLDRLHAQADCGLILFDHALRPPVPPVGDRSKFAEHRVALRRRILDTEPSGGTAYLDATAEAITLLQRVKGRRAVVLLTEGVDLNSRRDLQNVINLAQTAEVPVYTVGVGEPGKREPVTTVLVLDKSGSMRAPANKTERISK